MCILYKYKSSTNGEVRAGTLAMFYGYKGTGTIQGHIAYGIRNDNQISMGECIYQEVPFFITVKS